MVAPTETMRRSKRDLVPRTETADLDNKREQARRRHAVLIGALVIVVATMAGYWNSLQGAFVFDDQAHLLVSPPKIGFEELLFSSRYLTNVSFLANFAWGGTDARGFHAINLGIHVAAALLLFGLVRRTLLLPKINERFGNRATMIAALSALLWAVHPLTTESVTYIIQRAEALTGLFVFLALYCFARGAESRRRGLWWAASIAAMGLGMKSKETMIVAPLVLVLYDRVFVAESWRNMLSRKTFYAAVTIVTLLLLGPLMKTVLAEVVPLTVANEAVEGADERIHTIGVRPWQYLASQPAVILHYLQLTVWPKDLCIDYGWPAAERFAEVIAPGLMVLLLVGATGVLLWRASAWGFWAALFLIWLAPRSTLIPRADLAVEHRMYVPLAALIVLAVLVADRLIKRLGSTENERAARFVGGAALALAVAIVIALTARTAMRNKDYRSQLALWEQTVGVAPHNARARCNYALALQESGELEAAFEQYAEALRLAPQMPYAHFNLGNALVAAGDMEEATASFERAVQISPRYKEAWNNLGYAQLKRGDLAAAEGSLNKALELAPDYGGAYSNLGLLRATQGNDREAVAAYTTGLEHEPDNAELHNNLALVHARRGQLDQAMVHWDEAVRIKPDYAGAHRRLAAAFEQRGQFSRAIDQYRLLVELEPRRPQHHIDLGRTLARTGQVAAALESISAALALDPGDAGANAHAAEIFAAHGQLPEAQRHLLRAIERRPEDAELRVRLGLVLERMGGAGEARGQYEEAIRLAPESFAAHLNLAACLSALDEKEAALVHSQRAVQLNPNHAGAHNNLANLLARMGRREEAIEHYRRALAIDPALDQARQNLKRVEEDGGDGGS